MKTAIAVAGAIIVGGASAVRAEGCNIADVLFGKVRIEIIQHQGDTAPSGQKLAGYETGIIFGNDFDSPRFSYDKILGQVAPPERDGSMRITNVNGELCGSILRDMSIDNSSASCGGCSKTPINLLKISPNSYVVRLKGGNIVGTIEGRLNK
jgi:hypothetical protein